MKTITNFLNETYTGNDEKKSLSEWALVIASYFPDIRKSEVYTVVNGRWLKKTHESGMDALLEQAAKKDGDWCFEHVERNVFGARRVSWEFTRPEYVCVREPGIVIC